jgi:phage terminase large subunit-like protein
MPRRYGNQKPRIDIYQNGEIWLAEKTIELIEHYGIMLFPWQKQILYRWMAVIQDENGDWKWANPDCGLTVPRQNGKTELIIARIIGGMIFLNEAMVYTAQSDKTVREIKRRVMRFFYDAEEEIRNMLTDDFDGEPKSLDYIELRKGGRCVFSTRTRTSGLGATSDVLLVDEAQEQTDAQQEALLPTLAAGKNQNRQTISAGTPPTAGSAGTVWTRWRKNILDGKDPEACWQEWSVESITDNSNEEAWYETNPSLGYILMKSAVAKEATKMAIDSFNKMRLGWYAGVESMRAISDDEWMPLAVTELKIPDDPNIVYAVKFSPDRSSVSLAVGVLMPNGKVHVEVLERRPMSAGTAWLVAWLLERWRKCNKIIIDGAAGTQLLVEELVRSEKRISKKILTPNVREAGAAYAAFYNSIQQGTLTHHDQPLLNVSIRTVKKRDIGRDGMFGYASMNPDIQSDPTEAAAFACYGAVRFKKDKGSSGSVQRIMV